MAGHLKVLPALGLCLLTLLAFVPLMPTMPKSGLDPSWAWALNEGVAQHMAFGRDLVFTFGPLSGVSTRLYHPSTDAIVIGASGYLGLATASALYLVAAPGNVWALFLFPVLIAAIPNSDALYLYLPVLLTFAASRVMAGRSASARTSVRAAVIACMASSLALLPLIKASLAIGAIIGASTVLLRCARCSWRHAACSAVACVSVLLGGWLLTGQALVSLPAYLRTSVELMSGYTTAMALYGADPYPQMFALAAYTFFVSVLAWISIRASHHEDWMERALQVIVTCTALAMVAKASFVPGTTESMWRSRPVSCC